MAIDLRPARAFNRYVHQSPTDPDVIDLRPYRLVNRAAPTVLEDCYTYFDKTNEYTNIGNDTSLDVNYNTAYTYMFWIKVDGAQLAGQKILFRKYDLVSKLNNISLNFANLQFDLYNTTGNRLQKTVTLPPLDFEDIWKFVVVTKDATGTAAGVNIYFDGVLQSPTSTIDTLGTTNTVSTADLAIGGDIRGLLPWHGGVQEACFVNREMSAGELLSVFALGHNAPNYSGIPNVVMHNRMDTLNPVDLIGVNDGISVNQDASNIICE